MNIKLKSRQLTQIKQIKILWGDDRVELIFRSGRKTVRYAQKVTMKDMNKKEVVIYSIEVILKSIRRKISKKPDLVILKQSVIQLKYIILKERIEVEEIEFSDFESDIIKEKKRKEAIKIMEGRALLNFLLFEYDKKVEIGKKTLELVDLVYDRKYRKKMLANYKEALPFSIHPQYLLSVHDSEMKELMIYLVDETIIWNEMLNSNRNIENYILEVFCTIYDIDRHISSKVKTLTDALKNIIFKMANNAIHKNSMLGHFDKFENVQTHEISINIFQIARNEILIGKTFETLIKKKEKLFFQTVSALKNSSKEKIELIDLWESSIIEYPKLNVLSKIIEFNTLLVNRVLEIDPITFEKVDLNVLESALLIALGFRNSIMESIHILGIPFDIITVPSLLNHLFARFDELKEYITHLRNRDDYQNWLSRLLIMYAPGWQHLSPETDIFNINNYWDLIENEKLDKNVHRHDIVGIE